MTPTDLLKLCDEVLELSGRATKGPFVSKRHPSFDQGFQVISEGEEWGLVANVHYWSRPHEQIEANAELFATSRTALPILASALKKLVPYVEHKGDCNQWAPELSPMPFAIARVASRRCTCGLSSALSEIGINPNPKDS